MSIMATTANVPRKLTLRAETVNIMHPRLRMQDDISDVIGGCLTANRTCRPPPSGPWFTCDCGTANTIASCQESCGDFGCPPPP